MLYTCLDTESSISEQNSKRIIIEAPTREEAQKRAEPRLLDICKCDTPEGFSIISIDTHEELKEKKEPIPRYHPR